MNECPCGSGQALEACCGPYLEGGQWPATAEALMRARYCAHVRANVSFIIDSNHPDTRAEIDRGAVERWASRSEWLGLEIREIEGGGPDDGSGTVEFVARYLHKGEPVRHHELALFEKHAGRWYFKDALPPPVAQVMRAGPKVGRNDPCPCGSGKKYKKCCGR